MYDLLHPTGIPPILACKCIGSMTHCYLILPCFGCFLDMQVQRLEDHHQNANTAFFIKGMPREYTQAHLAVPQRHRCMTDPLTTAFTTFQLDRLSICSTLHRWQLCDFI